MREFGETVFNSSGELDREALGDIIFNDIDKRKKLNDITHPEIYKEMLKSAVNYLFEGKLIFSLLYPYIKEEVDNKWGTPFWILL
jgi:dephospho-CoA kinase